MCLIGLYFPMKSDLCCEIMVLSDEMNDVLRKKQGDTFAAIRMQLIIVWLVAASWTGV